MQFVIQAPQSKTAIVVAWVASAIALVLALAVAMPFAQISSHRSAMIGDWTTEVNGQESGVSFYAEGKGSFTAGGQSIATFQWEIKTPGVIYIQSAKSMYMGYAVIPGQSLRIGEGSEETIYRKTTR